MRARKPTHGFLFPLLLSYLPSKISEVPMSGRNFIHSHSGSLEPIISNEAITGAYKMTSRNTFIDRAQMMSLLMWLPDWDGKVANETHACSQSHAHTHLVFFFFLCFPSSLTLSLFVTFLVFFSSSSSISFPFSFPYSLFLHFSPSFFHYKHTHTFTAMNTLNSFLFSLPMLLLDPCSSGVAPQRAVDWKAAVFVIAPKEYLLREAYKVCCCLLFECRNVDVSLCLQIWVRSLCLQCVCLFVCVYVWLCVCVCVCMCVFIYGKRKKKMQT